MWLYAGADCPQCETLLPFVEEAAGKLSSWGVSVSAVDLSKEAKLRRDLSIPKGLPMMFKVRDYSADLGSSLLLVIAETKDYAHAPQRRFFSLENGAFLQLRWRCWWWKVGVGVFGGTEMRGRGFRVPEGRKV